jgi:hypothetical protein
MRARTLSSSFAALCFTALAVSAAPAGAIPPPPAPEMQASMNAMNSLYPAFGTWVGKDDDGRELVRKFARGPGDVIYFDAGLQRQGVRFIDVIAFDVKSNSLEIFLPGYRARASGGASAQLLPLEHSDNITLRWSEHGFPCNEFPRQEESTKRTSVWVLGDEWRETVECISKDGKAFWSSSATLKRSGPAEVQF